MPVESAPHRTRRTLNQRILPGFGLSLGVTVFYLGLLIIIPLAGLFFKSLSLGWEHFLQGAFDPRALASYKVTLRAALIGALINAVFGLITAWVLVRYSFPGKRVVDAFVDLPFALPTAVAGIALTTLYAPEGWIGALFQAGTPLGSIFTPEGWVGRFIPQDSWLGNSITPEGLKIAYTELGIIVALTFIGLPFVVRTVQPILEDLSGEIEEAAASLGAGRGQTFLRVIFPELMPALLTGFALAFARAVGEFGSVVFIAGNMPMKTEISPLLIIIKLEQYDYAGATAIAVVMLVASFFLLLLINLIQWWSSRFYDNR
ncbi:MAG: sulfate ABC transporter permease subunit CysT [Candidatus Methylacidiphilales bacterium]|nr:sulfate ABC transporter permease subunit CysT [Candidatus Methylacidiphilales bacterium]